MARRIRLFVLASFATLVAGAEVPRDARACAAAMPEGERVSIFGEQAVIVWDAARRREHFIRRADFDASAEHFGFLVPTPSPPTLSEVDDGVFETLGTAVAPAVETRTEYSFLTCCTAPFLMMLGAAGDDAVMVSSAVEGVQVLSEQRVAGMDATVLAANDAGALGGWLGEHGYANRPALVEWLEPYVARGYALTAFRYAKDGSPRVGSRAVRLSFDTDRPFYPYRETSDQPEEWGRRLRVYLVSDARMEADEWGARLEHAAPLEDDALLGALAPDAPTGGRWLTSFIDSARTRAGHDDLFFAPSDDRAEVHPPPIVRTETVTLPIPIEPLLLLGLGVALWRWRRRRLAAATPPAG